MVHAIFGVEELPRRFGSVLHRRPDIAAGAKAASLAMVNDHRLHRGVGAPFEQGVADRLAHLQRQRVDRARSPQRDMAHTPMGANFHVGRNHSPLASMYGQFSAPSRPPPRPPRPPNRPPTPLLTPLKHPSTPPHTP